MYCVYNCKKLPIEENKSDDKLFDIVKKIVLNLIDNAKSNDGGKFISFKITTIK